MYAQTMTVFYVRTLTATSVALQTTKSLTCVMQDSILPASVIGLEMLLDHFPVTFCSGAVCGLVFA